jgi:hypothetical protein
MHPLLVHRCVMRVHRIILHRLQQTSGPPVTLSV